MSYHVTIVRTQEGKQLPISRAETEAAVAPRADLDARPTAEGELEISVKELGDSSPLLIWQDGEIWTRNPEDSTLALMIDLAKALDARVRGDEMETYRAVDDSYQHPDDAEAIAATRKMYEGARARRNWIARAAPLVIFALLGMWVHSCSGR